MVISVVQVAFRLLELLILVRVLLSWIPHDPRNAVMRFVYETTEPVLAPFRRIMPRGGIPLDFSPILALLVLSLVEQLVIGLLAGLIW